MTASEFLGKIKHLFPSLKKHLDRATGILKGQSVAFYLLNFIPKQIISSAIQVKKKKFQMQAFKLAKSTGTLNLLLLGILT